MKQKLAMLAVLTLTVTVFGRQSTNSFVIERATLIDGTGRAIRDSAILVEGERIAAVGPRSNVKVPSGVQRIDARGKWIIPGLIDAHVHFDQSADLYTRPDIIDLRQWRPYEQEVEWTKNRIPNTLARYLSSGITGVVHMGGPIWSSFDVRDLTSRTKNAPRVAVAGPLISTYTPPYQDTRDPAVIEAKSPENARELVRQQLGRKPDLIKIWWIVNPGDDLQKQSAIMQAAIEESHSAGVRVAAHATELETAKAALRAGADILVHSVADEAIDNEFLNLVMRRDVLYMSTFLVEQAYAEVLQQKVNLSDIEKRFGDPEVIATWSEMAKIPAKDIPGGIPQFELPGRVAYNNLVLLESAGVRIVGATDAGNIGTLHGPALHREFELMAEAGLRPMSIIVSATKNAAAVMGKQNDVGTLEKGKFADLVILDGDPLADIKNTRKIYKVMKSGEFVRGE